jgi:hypothetical protein
MMHHRRVRPNVELIVSCRACIGGRLNADRRLTTGGRTDIPLAHSGIEVRLARTLQRDRSCIGVGMAHSGTMLRTPVAVVVIGTRMTVVYPAARLVVAAIGKRMAVFYPAAPLAVAVIGKRIAVAYPARPLAVAVTGMRLPATRAVKHTTGTGTEVRSATALVAVQRCKT